MKIFKNSKKTKAFTIIELLLVMAVIGILSSVALISIKGVKEKARDSIRKAELEEIQKALVMYHEDHGVYPDPTTSNNWYSSQPMGNWFPEISPYMTPPLDPLNEEIAFGNLKDYFSVLACGGCYLPYCAGEEHKFYYYYYYSTDPQKYILVAVLENKSDPHRIEVKDVEDPFYPGQYFYKNEDWPKNNYILTSD